MGILDTFKKVGKVAAEAMDKAAREMAYREKVYEIKVELLMRFKFEQLKRICAAKGISPTYIDYSDPFEIKEITIRTKDGLAKKLAENLSLSEVEGYAKRYKIKFSDLIRELEEAQESIYQQDKDKNEVMKEIRYIEQSSTESNDIIDIIEDFRPEIVHNEEDLEKQLYQYLSAKLGRGKVRRQVPTQAGKIDLIVDDAIAIEVKIAEKRDSPKMLIGQVTEYLDTFDNVLAFILDIGANVDLDYYEQKIRQLGAEVITISGTVKRRGRGKNVIIKL